MNSSSDLIIAEEDDCSDDGLKIVIDAPQCKRKPNKSVTLAMAPEEQEVIESVENEIEKTLDEKAAKTNLSTSNVKEMLKQVVTNEHVLAMVRQAEDPDNDKESHHPTYEPKLTRAKAKELYSTQTISTLPWPTPLKSRPDVQVLINEELREDSSDDEYVPAEEESEDDKEGSVVSEKDPTAIDPPTPKVIDLATQTNWLEDGVFKTSPLKTNKEATDETNIALRTRSKLCLSSTPLEVIEEAFIPPDITTDMYDMDCDDDEWSDFLKKFTRPLDEVIRHAEDEDHDPEYNVLADEQIDKMDKEELREDKGVKVTRKELNELVAELFDYADNFTADNQAKETEIDPQPQFTVLESQSGELTEETATIQNEQQNEEPIVVHVVEVEPPMIEEAQKLLLEQQMRQHVQMLTQNFLLLYEHFEFAELAEKCKEYLYNLMYLPGERKNSYFVACNLHSAIKLIEWWQAKLNSDDNEARATREFVGKVIMESKQSKSAGIPYIPTFPPLIMETISKSNVFLYPWLLPRIPFKSACLSNQKEFNVSDDELIALGLEQFTIFLKDDSYHVSPKGGVRLPHICHYIQRYMMISKDATRLYKHVCERRHSRTMQNPIKYYFDNGRAPSTLHYVVTLDQLGVTPPCQRKMEQLPYQWKQYIYPNAQNATCLAIPINSNNITKVVKPPVYNKNRTNRRRIASNAISKALTKSSSKGNNRLKIQQTSNSIASEPSFDKFLAGNKSSSTPKCKTKQLSQYFSSTVQVTKLTTDLKHLKFNSTIFENLRLSKEILEPATMLPSMPSLNTFAQHSPERETPAVDYNVASIDINKIASIDDRQLKNDDNDVKAEVFTNAEKDNLDDINALMKASSTIKTITKKKLSGAEKKKAKLQKEYNANMLMLSPEDPSVTEEKTSMYVQAFYDKLQERLDMHDYHKLLEVLNGFDENKGSVSGLYQDVNKILHPKYPDLIDEFLMFLTSSQAQAVGKLVPHLMLSNMSLFLRKLEMYFKEQPSQVRKIYRSLTELTNCVDITMDKVKSTILPLLKGNTLLTDWFLQIFPCEKPPKSLLDGPWETIEIGKENAADDIYENIVVPEVEDPYGGPNCICSCHSVDDQTFKSRLRHCIPCGTKFLQGRVYIQTGKGLRLAKVTFNSNSNVDHYARLNYRPLVPQQKRKTEANHTKQISPSKDSQDEIRMSNESEDDAEPGRKKQTKSVKKPRKRKPKKAEKSAKITKEKLLIANNVQSVGVPQVGGNTKVLKNCKETIIDRASTKSSEAEEPLPSCSGLNQQKPAVVNDEAMEWDCNTSIGSFELELHLSPSMESESEENSQDNRNSDSDDVLDELKSPTNLSSSLTESSNTAEELSWTRDEDKVILETLQKEGNREETFTRISQLLENRSIVKIKTRFQTLLSLLQALAAEST